MAINFRKLKKQIKPFMPEAGGPGFIFIATAEQNMKSITSIAKQGSKKSLMKALSYLIAVDEDFREEFAL